MKNHRSITKLVNNLTGEELARATMLEAREAMEHLEADLDERPLRSLSDASHRLSLSEHQRFFDLRKAGFNAMLYVESEVAAARYASSLWGAAGLGAQGWEIAAEIADDARHTLCGVVANGNLTGAVRTQLAAVAHALRIQADEARAMATELNGESNKARSHHQAAVARLRDRAATVAAALGGEIDIIPQRIKTAIAQAEETFANADHIRREIGALNQPGQPVTAG